MSAVRHWLALAGLSGASPEERALCVARIVRTETAEGDLEDEELFGEIEALADDGDEDVRGLHVAVEVDDAGQVGLFGRVRR